MFRGRDARDAKGRAMEESDSLGERPPSQLDRAQAVKK